jgi:WD40 repeat protein
MKLPTTALCLAAHSSLPHIAAGLVLGGVAEVIVGGDTPLRVTSLPDSIRAVAYAAYDASASSPLFAASNAGRLYQIAPESCLTPSTYLATREKTPLSAVASFELNVVVAGDDEGGLHMFDTRLPTSEPVASVLEQGDYISSIQKLNDSSLVVASGDGALSVYDMRRPPHGRLKLVAATPTFDDDLLSLALLGSGERAVGGTLSGALNVYNMSFADADENEPDMARFIDRFFGHPESVSAILAVEEHGVVLTGSSDGLVRVIDPSKKVFLGVLPYLLPAEDDDDDDEGVIYGSNSAIEMAAYANGKGNVEGETSDVAQVDEDDISDDSDISGVEDGDDDDKHDDSDPAGDAAVEIDDNDDDGSVGDREEPSTLVQNDGNSSTGSKSIAWPIEAMAFVKGIPSSQIAVIGHSSRIRFCDASLLDESEGEAEDETIVVNENGGNKAQGDGMTAVLPSRKSLLQNEDAKADFDRASRASKRRRKGGAAARPAAQASFFADL